MGFNLVNKCCILKKNIKSCRKMMNLTKLARTTALRFIGCNLKSNYTTQSTSLPNEVTIVEVGPRDGLQNEKQLVPADKKIEFINLLSESGLKRIEVTSFVSPKWVPQMGDCKEVMNGIKRASGVRYSVLTPNIKGFQDAIQTNAQEIAIFGAASESFSKKNINCSIKESLDKFQEVVNEANKLKIPIRGYISCVVGCPYEGYIKPSQVCQVVEQLLKMGCYEISLGDTIGVGNPKTINQLLGELKKVNSNMNIYAIHCHDTYGLALLNIYEALENGIKVIDSSCAGLGGCPYAAGASGNVATEDVLNMLNSLGVKTNVNMDKILEASQFIMKTLNRETRSKAGLAIASKKLKKK